MSLNTTIDLTKVVSTLVSSVEPHTSVLTSYGTLTTNLGTSNTYLTSTVLQTGLQGEQGIQGAEGKSAYEVWITSGNTGTEQDFLDSLVSTVPGPQGVQGPIGPQGIQGIQGVQGEAGPIGPKGNTGEVGAQGIQGVQGIKGDQGDVGPQGIQGLPGPKGDTGPVGPAGYTPIKGVDYFDGEDGNSPVVTLVGDQIVIDGVTQPTHLTGPQGPAGQDGSDSPLGEAPLDGKQYVRRNGTWEEVIIMATFDAVLDFDKNKSIATSVISDTTMTATKIIQCFFTDKLDEVAIQNMRVTERARTVGVGFEIIGVAPDGAFGTYPVRCIVSGT